MRSIVIISALALAGMVGMAQVDPPRPPSPDHERHMPRTLTVNGRGEASAAPNRAVVRLGAVAQAEQASASQGQVNEIVQAAIDAILALDIDEDSIATVDLSLHPVYHHDPRPVQGGSAEPRIVAFRASNTIRVQLDDLSKIGQVIDAGVQAGANQIQGISFELRDDTEQRAAALRRAVQSARTKAEAIAEAMGVRLESVREVVEGGVQVFTPQPEFMRMGVAMAADVATPVQPGQVQVEATVTVRYEISEFVRPRRDDNRPRIQE